MAQININKSLLKKTSEIYLKTAFVLLAIFISYSLFFVSYKLFYSIYIIPIIPILFISIYFLKEHSILKYGYSGETKTMKILSKLDDDYVVFNNVKVCYEGNQGELDFLVIGKRGVFIIEVKNHRGTITGRYNDKKWKQTKSGKSGIEHDNLFYNPVKQVKTHVFKLAKEMKEDGIDIWVQGIVFFSNSEAVLKNASFYQPIPTFNDGEKMLEYIKNFKIKNKFPEKQKGQLIKKIEEKQ